jgi:O-methyltransferase
VSSRSERSVSAVIAWLERRGIIVHRRGTPENFSYSPATGRHYPVDFTQEWIETIEQIAPYTMTNPERAAAVCWATEYLVAAGVAGSFVECGVWRGGSSMAAALTLKRLDAADRDLYLFDTYAGMTRPTEADVDYAGIPVLRDWPAPEDDHGVGAVALGEVQRNFATTGYPSEHLHYVVGDVLETIPGQAPEQIALLRLDTDWYESTKHELVHLYPRLVPGGVLIIDDYGHLEGSRQAADEYFADHPLLLARTDYSGRLGVKR